MLQHAVWFDVGVFQVHVSQHILKLLHKFYENVLRQRKSTQSKPNKPRQEQCKESIEETNMQVVKDMKLLSSEDDLRNGMFEYIVAKGIKDFTKYLLKLFLDVFVKIIVLIFSFWLLL